MKIPATLAAAAIVAVFSLVTACGSEHASGSGATHTARPAVSLTVTVRPAAHAAPHSWTVTCGPTGGSLPGAARACSALSKVKDPFAPVPRGVMCSMIYSGPQTATVDGIWHGKAVHATFSRTDGCQTRRWSRIAALFGPYATPSPGSATQ